MAKTFMAKDNFWNRLRVERNISHKELAQFFNVSLGGEGAWFSGEVMPDDNVISQLCSLFDVDFGQGKREFENAHRAWESEHHKAKAVLITGSRVSKKKATPPVEEIPVETPVEVVEETEDILVTAEDFLAVIYGDVMWSTYNKAVKLLDGVKTDPFEAVYGKLTYSEFCECERAFRMVNV